MYFSKEQILNIDYKIIELHKDKIMSIDLLSEENHNVKNNLHIVLDLLKKQIYSCSLNFEIKETSDAVGKRIGTKSFSNRHLYKNGNPFQLNLREYIQDIVQHTLVVSNSKEIVSVDTLVDDIFLNIETAAHIGLIIYKLLMNSIKHCLKKDAKENKLFIRILKKGQILAIKIKVSGNGLPYLNHNKSDNSIEIELVQTIARQYAGSVFTFNKETQTIVFLNIE